MIIYINARQQIKVRDKKVMIKDLGQIYCKDEEIHRAVGRMVIYEFAIEANHHTYRKAISVMDVIEKITDRYPDCQVESLGEANVLVGFDKRKKPAKLVECAKIFLVCLLVFFGAAFTIMAFNNDISIQGVFDLFYLQIMGTKKPTFSELEIAYSVGMAVGIIVFFNHIGRKRITNDMTPIEVEFDKHKKDICEAMLDAAEEEVNNR